MIAHFDTAFKFLNDNFAKIYQARVAICNALPLKFLPEICATACRTELLVIFKSDDASSIRSRPTAYDAYCDS